MWSIVLLLFNAFLFKTFSAVHLSPSTQPILIDKENTSETKERKCVLCVLVLLSFK